MSWRRVALYFVLVLFALYYLLPVYVLLVTSLKDFKEVSLRNMWNPPRSFSLQSFIQAWKGDQNRSLGDLS
ncbi:ABC transporter permease family protein [Pseudothermotoga thermarum]|uniref:hypothetical protein n=1 Tax=Pseudothermotoga thermarum TaxID=119394 RepID=UPI0002D46655|nr:hypothetical protein [Pseudothermotoga thermarum]